MIACHNLPSGDQDLCKNVTILTDVAAVPVASFHSGILMGEWRGKSGANYQTGDWLASRRDGRKWLPA